MEPNFVDEIDCGNFFDQIDDLIDFPPESESDVNLGNSSGDCNEFPSMWKEALPEPGPLFSGGGNCGVAASDLSAELDLPYEDIVQLEWLSTFVEESFSSIGMTLGKENVPIIKNEKPCNQFQSPSPNSVLESSSSSSSSSSGGKTLPIKPTHQGPQRARSKRPRPATFNPRPAIQLISPSSSEFPPEPENFTDLPPVKNKKIKFSGPVNSTGQSPTGQAIRKCMHCEITKTPQWRAGPMGPKTLCNACGVRHKSGRLFPEYRPAASPTFVPSLHSNSHRKVVEMRSKVEPEIKPATTTCTPIV